MLTLVMLLAEAVVHYHIDWAKDGLNRRLGATPDRRAFWVLAGTDQGLHQLTYVGHGGLVGRRDGLTSARSPNAAFLRNPHDSARSGGPRVMPPLDSRKAPA